jgi:hypothetical protein
MKIILEHYEHKLTYEIDHDDVSLDSMLEIIERMLLADGYVFRGTLQIVDDEDFDEELE